MKGTVGLVGFPPFLRVMMNYATKQDMIDAFGEDEVVRLTDAYVAPGVIDEATLTRALDRASDRINGFVSARYPQSFENIPKLLIGICCDLVRYDLSGTGNRIMSDEVRDRKSDAYKLLGMIADGRVKMGLDVAEQPVDWGPGVQRIAGDSSLSNALEDY